MAFTIVGDAAMISGDTANSRKAAVFTGGDTDDAYTIDALAAARTAANDTAGTITAWVMPGDITSTMGIVSFEDANVVENINLRIAAGKLTASCTDATTAQWSITSPSVNIPAHKWTHVALVHDGVRPMMYVNGVRVNETVSLATDLTDWFSTLDGVDNGSIGASRVSGTGAYTQEFVGGISDVKYWNVALTADQLLEEVNGVHHSTGCIAWYDWEGLTDKATGGGTYDATAVSDVYLTPTYNEFISRVRKFGAVVADVAGFTDSAGKASIIFINAA